MLRFLVLTVLLSPAVLFGQLTSASTPLVTIDYDAELSFVFDAALARTADATWIATPGGLYRLPLNIEEGEPQLFAFEGRGVTKVYAHDGALYVLKDTRGTSPGDHDPGLLRLDPSSGEITQVDAQLRSCTGEVCQYMAGSEAKFVGQTIYYAAGGNLVVSPDGGETWKALVGFLEPAACYDLSFELSGSRLLYGGECPLDMAWLRWAELSSDGTAIDAGPFDAVTPELENRNIQFIRRLPGSSLLFAGIEGAMLRSSDFGASWEFVHRYHNGGADEGKYPYIGSLLAPSGREGVLVAGGFDKAKAEAAAWLAISHDGGSTWLDRSVQLRQSDGFSADTLSFLAEDADGRILAGLVDLGSTRLRVVELSVEPSRRRAVRRP